MSETVTVKQVLLELLTEVEDLKSDLVVVLENLDPPLKLGEAYDQKSSIAKAVSAKYASLRSKIEGLS